MIAQYLSIFLTILAVALTLSRAAYPLASEALVGSKHAWLPGAVTLTLAFLVERVSATLGGGPLFGPELDTAVQAAVIVIQAATAFWQAAQRGHHGG